VQELEADLVLWTAGSQPSSKGTPDMNLPFPLTDKGAMKTDDTLQVVGNPHVFALGDVASSASKGQELTSLPATAQVLIHRLKPT
jgi:NADH:ubiquinone reductase (non-electrogenic)